MCALGPAFSCQRCAAVCSDSPKSGTAKSMIVVVPPQAAAAVPEAKSSEEKVPPNGISMWVWTSIPPGMTRRPPASMMRSASASRPPLEVTAATRSPSISTSADMVSLAVTTVPPLIRVRMDPPGLRQELGQLGIRLGAAVAEELPGVADLAGLVEVQLGDQHLVGVLGGSGDDLPARVAEVARPVEPVRVQRLLGAHPVDGRDPVAVGHRVRRLLQLPQVAGQRLDRGGGVEHQLGALEPELPGNLGEVPVVADDQPDAADRGVEHRVAEVPRLEVVLLPEAGADLGNVRLAVLAEHTAVAFDDHRRVVVDARLGLLVERHDQGHAMVAGQLAHAGHGR